MAQQPLLEARQLTKVFVRGSFLSGRSTVRAVDDVSLSIDQGDTFGIVGESGSGKSTLARLVMRLVEPTSGTVRFDGRDLLALDTSALRGMRRHMQLVFQNPYTSLNPRMHVGDIISEPLVIHGCGDARERVARTAEVLAQVGLSHDLMKRLPKELSGGQCQRVGIARALVLNPKLVVLDEPVSALDVSI